MYLYWDKTITDNYYGIKYSLSEADVVYRNIINIFRNMGGAQAIAANINFQMEIFNLEQSGKALSNRTRRFDLPTWLVRC